MNELVFKGQNDQVVTTSLKVAEVFGKEHRRVLQDIRDLNCSDNFRLHNFVQSSYTNTQNKEMPMYIMTRDGFTLLVMGYTGERAMEFKESYINAFNEMERSLQSLTLASYQITDPIERAKKWIEEETVRQEQAKQLEEMKPKALFADAVASSSRSCLVAELAKILKQNGIDTGQNRLFQWLRGHGYLGSKGDYYNQPTQTAMDMGLFEIKKRTIANPDGSTIVTTTTKVTPKGQIYFVQKFLGDLK